jgi:hypothetical protein
MGRFTLALSMLALCIALIACTAPRTPNARKFQTDSYSFLVTDARQRVVAGNTIGSFSRPGLVDPESIYCAEPSPDVASAVATSFSGALSVLGKGSASLSEGQVESMAQLVERTASIQLLRDKMFQTCVAYANGAITGTTYSLIMAQLDRTIVTLLLGENAAAAFGRAGAAAGGEAMGEATSGISGPSGTQDIAAAVDAVAEAQTNLKAAEEKLAAAHKERGEACGLEKGTETGPGEACQAINAEEKKVAAAQNRLDATLRLLQTTASVRSNVAARTTKVAGIGGLNRTPTPELARELRLIQDNFLSQDSVEHFLPTCLVELGLHNEAGSVTARILDTLVSRLHVAETEAEEAADLAGTEAAQKRAGAASQELGRFLSNPESLLKELRNRTDLDPHRVVFEEVLQRWRNGLTGDETRLGKDGMTVTDLAAAANQNRRSILAAQCVALLPDHLRWMRISAQSYRNARLEVLRQIELAGHDQRNVAARTELLAQFKGAMTACKEGDEKQRAGCETVVRKIVDGAGGAVDDAKKPGT